VSPSARAPLAIAIAAAAVYALAFGLRQAQPLFIGALNSHTGIGYAAISLAFGVAQLVWGFAQPVAGAVSDRFGPRRVMIGGAMLLAAANSAIPFISDALVLTLVIGIAAALGAGTMGPAMLLGAASRWIPEAKRSVAHGIINAGGSFGQFTVVPLAQLLIGLFLQPAKLLAGEPIEHIVKARGKPFDRRADIVGRPDLESEPRVALVHIERIEEFLEPDEKIELEPACAAWRIASR